MPDPIVIIDPVEIDTLVILQEKQSDPVIGEVVAVRGPKGETGAIGPQGPQGPQGPLGPPGADGLTEAEVIDVIRSENVFANYKTQEIDEEGLATYVGQLKITGEWFMSKLVDGSGDIQITYANVSNNGSITTFSAAWTNRYSLTYALISSLTGI